MKIEQEEAIKNALILATRNAFDVANDRLKRTYKYPEIIFTLRGRTAGLAYLSQNLINYNLELASRDINEFLKKICYHESAHIIAHLYCGPNIRPHGNEWKWVMREVFYIPAERCHSIDTSGCRARKTYLHVYNCACGQEILVGTKHHRVIQANGTVFHKRCRLTISRAWFKRTIEKV